MSEVYVNWEVDKPINSPIELAEGLAYDVYSPREFREEVGDEEFLDYTLGTDRLGRNPEDLRLAIEGRDENALYINDDSLVGSRDVNFAFPLGNRLKRRGKASLNPSELTDTELENIVEHDGDNVKYWASNMALGLVSGGIAYAGTGDPGLSAVLGLDVVLGKVGIVDAGIRNPYKNGKREVAIDELNSRKADGVQDDMESEDFLVVPVQRKDFEKVRSLLDGSLKARRRGPEVPLEIEPHEGLSKN